MTSRRKRLLIAGIIVALLLGAGLYRVYFTTTNVAIREAESFLFRRPNVARIDEKGQYRHFWITNRVRNAGDQPLIEQFSNERESILKFGTYDTSLSHSLSLGMLINPNDWFQSEQISLDNVKELERDAFIGDVRKLVDASPRRSLLVILHGFREQYASALIKTTFIGSVLDINTPVLVFDWPGDQGSSLRGYRAARSVAEESGAELAAALALLIREVKPDRISLVANSMGAQVVVDAFSVLYQQEDFADSEAEIVDVVLTAPDVDHADFNAQFKKEILALSRRLIVYVSSNDRALVASRLINRSKRAGESTLSPDQLAEAESIAGLMEPNSDRITLVDVTPVNRTRNFHNFSLEVPEYYDDLFLRLTNDELPANRRIYPVRASSGEVYWVLTRGR
jgi:esterase/lipase superfamily enzyme